MNHPLLSVYAAIDAAFDEITGSIRCTCRWSRGRRRWSTPRGCRARPRRGELRLLAASGDIAEATGARSTATWVAGRDPRSPRRRTPPRVAGCRARRALGPGRRRLGGRRPEPRPGPRHRRGPRRAARRPRRPACWPRPRPTWSSRPPSSGRASWPGSARASWRWSPPTSPRRPTTRGSSPPSAVPGPRPSCSSAPAAMARPTSTPGSRTTSPTGCAPTSTATPARATSAWATSTPSRCRAAAARRSAPCWRTCPPPACPARAAPPPRSPSPSSSKTLLDDLGTAGVAVTSTGDQHHRRPGPSAGLPGRDHALRDERQVRHPRPGPRQAPLLRRPPHRPEPALPRVHGRRLLDPRRLVRSPPQGALVQGRQDPPRGRHPPLPLPPPPRPRPRLEHHLPPRRHDHLHPTPIAPW